MTITQMDSNGNNNKNWCPERLITINRSPSTSLGLSIVGGSVDVYNGISGKYENISGIFIKKITPGSPADQTGNLKTGDRIIEVDGRSVENCTNERAVEMIQSAGNPLRLLVQSMGKEDENVTLNQRKNNSTDRRIYSEDKPSSGRDEWKSSSGQPEVIQEGSASRDTRTGGNEKSTSNSISNQNDVSVNRPENRRPSVRKSIKKTPAPQPEHKPTPQMPEIKENHVKEAPKTVYSSEESSDDEDTRHMEGNVYTKAGVEISRKSAGNVKRSREEIEADEEEEDQFGYTQRKVQKKYRNLGHTVVMVTLEKDRRGLGIALAGHKDRNKMAVYICGLNPNGVATKTGGLKVGDEILEVNGHVLQNRCHLNASSIIKGIPGNLFKIIVVRRKTGTDEIAVKPLVQFPTALDEDEFSDYKGVHSISVKKGQYGLGIMIIEGKHAEVGQGIFVSDIQEGSAAEQAGLQVGELILAVNFDCLLGSTYDAATSLLKKTEGVVRLTVCNPNQSKVAQEELDKANNKDGAGDAPKADAPKEPEKPKEPEAPKDPKTCEIAVGKDTNIEFPRENDLTIGLAIVGGSDTPLVGVFILDVFTNGAAGKDGRLKPGDQIIDLCGEKFKGFEHEKAYVSVLKAGSPITMIVLREQKVDEIDVELAQKAGKGIGLCITGFSSGTGAYITELVPGCSAVENGKLLIGDTIAAVGGEDVRSMNVEDIALLLKVSNPVQLKVARFKTTRT